MKKLSILLIVVLLTCLALTVFATEEVKYDFRKTTWGMSKEEVRAAESKELYYEGNSNIGHSIVYEIKIGNKDYGCIYVFLEDKLYNGGYVFNEEHTNKNDYIDDYEELKEILTEKYGKPDEKKLWSLHDRGEMYWKDDSYRDDRSRWGMAISKGDLAYGSIWETPTTDIELILDGDNYDVSLRIRYISKELKEWANKILKEKTKSNF